MTTCRRQARAMKAIFVFATALLLTLVDPVGAQDKPGTLKGGIVYSIPSWFKPSFLDFREDVAEARRENRHVMLFLHLDECPYCARMLSESFVAGDNHTFIRDHFDVIAVNVRGAQEVKWIDGVTYTEQALSRQLKAFGTPTLVFLGHQGDVVLKLVGYRDPGALRVALDYVNDRRYANEPFANYVASRGQPAVYTLRDHPQLSAVRDFSGYRGPLAILFEDRSCTDCARFHDKTLNHPDVIAEMKPFLFVRLDTGSAEPVVGLDGRSMASAEWAEALGLTYRPAIVLFDEGREIFRMDGGLYHFHFKEALRFVSGGYYKRYPSMSSYNAARRIELRNQGIDIDYSE